LVGKWLIILMKADLLYASKASVGFLQRISLMDTSSFAEIPPPWQNHLRWLHDDYYYHRHNQLWSAQVQWPAHILSKGGYRSEAS